MALGESLLLYGLGAGAAAAFGLPALKSRLELSRAKHRSLAGHAPCATRRRAGPGLRVRRGSLLQRRRRSGGGRARAATASRGCWRSIARGTRAAGGDRRGEEVLSDLQFTAAYRVPFQFSAHVRQHLSVGAFLAESAGPILKDLDGNRFYDLTGSYGGEPVRYDFYKACMAEGAERAARLGPVLGAYHPAVEYNVRRLRHLRARRGLVPHVGHRGGDAGGAPCPLSHGAVTSCASAAPIMAGGRTCSRGWATRAQPHDTR